ncbi:MAG: hypothetical protein H6669_01445 [Ardenticatenaceae bacterium]|nr:hypothetical protein [Ardenticatenaceae bacterium]
MAQDNIYSYQWNRFYDKSKYDAIIIGGGHNDLLRLHTLAKVGKKVAVLKKRYP